MLIMSAAMMSLQRKDLAVKNDTSEHVIDLTPGQGLVDWGLAQTSTSWDVSVRDEAVRRWFLVGMFPSVPAGDLLNVVRGVEGYELKEGEGGFVLTTPKEEV